MSDTEKIDLSILKKRVKSCGYKENDSRIRQACRKMLTDSVDKKGDFSIKYVIKFDGKRDETIMELYIIRK